jgi:hypothetical protein
MKGTEKGIIGCCTSSIAYLWKTFRMKCKAIVRNVWFDRTILLVIAFSSILLASSDYTHVDDQNNLIEEGSPTNTVILRCEIVFTVVFLVEFILKIVALGVYGTRHSYFNDPWNWLDFIVCMFSLLSFSGYTRNLVVFRTFRVLRPLKSIKSFPVLASIIAVVLKSLGQMRDISIVIIFLFLLFGIAGLQFFQGPYMHTRCRLTPFPVLNTWAPGMDMDSYRCSPAVNFNYPDEGIQGPV